MEGPDWEARGRWQVSGALIGCDASETRKTPFCNMWYHMSCCGLDFVPAGDWICPNCGGPPFPPASARKYLPHPESASGSSGSDDDGEDEYEHGRRFEPYAPPLTEAEIKAGTTLEHDDGTHSASLYAHFAPPPDIVPEARATRASIARAQANRLHETMMQERTSARRGGAGGDVESSSDTDSEFENASDDGATYPKTRLAAAEKPKLLGNAHGGQLGAPLCKPTPTANERYWMLAESKIFPGSTPHACPCAKLALYSTHGREWALTMWEHSEIKNANTAAHYYGRGRRKVSVVGMEKSNSSQLKRHRPSYQSYSQAKTPIPNFSDNASAN